MSGFGELAPTAGQDGRRALNEFETVLERCKRKSVIHTPPKDFILAGRLLAWFRSRPEHAPGTTNAHRLLLAVYGSTDRPGVIKNLLTVMVPGNECWLKVFAILLQLGKGKFIGRFWDSGVRDSRLSFISEYDLRNSIQHITQKLTDVEIKQFAEAFSKLQHQLCTQDSLDSENGRIESMTILPVCKLDPIKPGGSDVFQIEVPLECVPEKLITRIKTEPHKKGGKDGELYHEFALKVLQDKRDYRQETSAYAALKGREGIVQCLGFWEIQKGSGFEYHLLLEYGTFDLDEYFETFPAPSLPCDITCFWKDLSNVAIALDNIHNVRDTVEERIDLFYGWHLDIKPENILFCEGTWKIADPGFATFSRQTAVEIDENYLPVVPCRGGTKTYGPPEQAFLPKQPVTQRFDIWSLGCVFLEAATWILLGRRGVEQFRLVRKSYRSSKRRRKASEELRGDDCFHTMGDQCPSVLAWHTYLSKSLREGDLVTGAILTLIKDKMLVGLAKDRMSSTELVHALKSIISNAENDMPLSTYQPPEYFRAAFEAEQDKTTKEWSDPSKRPAPPRSNRYKSIRFQNTSGSSPINLDASRHGYGQVHTPLLAASASQLGQNMEPVPRRANTTNRSMTQNSSREVTRGASKSFDVLKRQISPPGEVEDPARFNYWDALRLLENQGWVQTGTLERDLESRAPLSPPMSNPSLSPASGDKGKRLETIPTLQRSNTTSRFSRQSISTSSSVIRGLFKRNSKSIDLSAGQNQPVTPTTTHHYRTESRTMTGTGEVDIKYKNNDFDQYFDKRDIIFLLDNGSTMTDHWPMARELVAVLVALLHGQDDNGMDIYFTSSHEKYGPFTEPKFFVDIINQMKPRDEQQQKSPYTSNLKAASRADDIRETLNEILNLVGKTGYERKLTLIILTDGIWKGIGQKRTVANGIINCMERWVDRGPLNDLLQNRGVSLQFVYFGDDKDAAAELEYMDNNLTTVDGAELPDIIDVEPATGNVKKMILGSLSDYWDDGGPATIASDDSQPRIRLGDVAQVGSQDIFSSPTQMHAPQFPGLGLVDEPVEYHPPWNYEYNPRGDTDFSGSQFGQNSPPNTGRQPVTSPRQMSGHGIPSHPRHRRSTHERQDSVSSSYKGHGHLDETYRR